MKVSRRSLLGAGAFGLAASAASRSGAAQEVVRPAGRPKNIIFCVADGMALSTPTMAHHFQQVVHGRSSYWAYLLGQDYVSTGLQETRSLNSLVTDSSAASSAWGCGRHIWNGQVNMLPDGTKLRTLVSLMKEAGVRTGLVTTCTITHATPAGFAVNCVQRDLEPLIAQEYLKTGVDVLMGGGDKFFSPKLRKDKRDLYADFAAAGYKVVKNKQELAGAGKADKLLGIFSESHMPYSVDHANSDKLRESTPSLAQMAQAAIDQLHGSPNGFLLQIEGGRVDHGGHGVDLAALLYDQIAFEEAVKAAVRYALRESDTLVIITADHATGGPALNGAGHEYIDSTAGLARVAGMKSSYGPVFKALGKTPTRGQVQDVVKGMLGIEFKKEEAAAVADAVKGKSPFALASFLGSSAAALALMLGNYTKVGWTSQNHTSDHVLVTAVGPGREAVTGLHPNVSYFDLILGFKGLKWDNPSMTFEDAQKHYKKLKASLDLDMLRQYAAHDGVHDGEECGCAIA